VTRTEPLAFELPGFAPDGPAGLDELLHAELTRKPPKTDTTQYDVNFESMTFS
jgi:hypothetical protein